MLFSTRQALRLGFWVAAGLLARPAAAQTWQSVVTPTGSGTLTVAATALDAAGNTVVTGSFTGTLQLGSFALISAGGADVFIAKLSPAGVWLLASRAGGAGADQATALVRDNNDEFVVTGQFGSPTFAIGTAVLLNTTAAGNVTDVFVARWTAAGSWDTAVSAGSVGYDYATGVGIDGGGTATIVGSFTGGIFTAGGLTLTNAVASGASSDLFAIRLEDTGAWTQAASLGGTGDESASAVGIGTGGEMVVAGSFTSASLSVAGTTLTNASPLDPEPDALVAWLSAAGSWTQAVQAGAAGADNLRALQVDAGEVIVVGDFTGPTTTFGTQTLTNADPSGTTSDMVVARLSAAGIWTQAVRAGSAGIDYATGLALGAQHTALVTGSFYGPSLALGTVTLANANQVTSSGDIFFAQLNAAGTWTQGLQAGGSGDDYAASLTTDTQGRAYVGGVVSGQGAQFGPVAIPSGSATGFIAHVGGLPLTPTATHQAMVTASVSLSPNPVGAGIPAAVAYELARPATVRVDVLDAVGRVLATGMPQQQSAGPHTSIVPSQSLAAGLYTVRLVQNSTATYRKLVVE